ncbi:unannotated protein [freshwater metagenome]|uniref:Unannotated protein n=1 Tax=freshwater metagenome TaxID=449393 RepID=A0A6J6EA18_9ZZZZ|nr:VTC domain-containing protein [Actinomycetota bacterium]
MDALSRFATISLEELSSQAELLRRFDTKYIVPLPQLNSLYDALPAATRILAVNGISETSYVTNYYDSADLHTYFDHLKQRRKRFKIRTRYYDEPANGYLEIKIKMPRGQTQKVRWALDVNDVMSPLQEPHTTMLTDALLNVSYEGLTRPYSQTLQTTFERSTLFDPHAHERITIDTHLEATLGNSSINLGATHAIVEIKSSTQSSQTHRIFTHMGIRPRSVSKYCVAMTALRPELGGAPWKSALHLLKP